MFAAGAFFACGSLDPEARDPFPVPSTGVVASPDPRVTGAALEILGRGGNAADAAVAGALMLSVVRPGAGPLGGGGVAVWVAVDPRAEPRVLDFREAVPTGLDPALLCDESGAWVPARARDGGLAVGVPGGWIGLHGFQRAVGRLSFAEVARPAIELARRGVPASAELRARLAADPALAAVFTSGAPLPEEGAPLSQEALARFLETLAQRGPEGLLETAGAEALCAAVRARGGVLERSDLQAYRPLWSSGLEGWFRGLEIVSAPPPSLGGSVFLESLLVLDGFPLDAEIERANLAAASMGQEVREEMRGLSSRALHWCVEALRLSTEDVHHVARAADPSATLRERLAPEHVVSQRVLIGESAHARGSWIDGEGESAGGESTIVVLDRAGNAVSLALGLGPSFGSGVFVPETGFFLNGAIDSFFLGDGGAGEPTGLAPGARPPTWRTPVVAREGGSSIAWVLGSSGGIRAPQALLQVFLRSEVHGQALEDAIGGPRLGLARAEGTLEFEPAWDPALLRGLERRQHVLVQQEGAYGIVQAIRAKPIEVPAAASDPRSSGSAGTQGMRSRGR